MSSQPVDTRNIKKLRGYVFSRPADGQLVPQRLQNMMIREYIESRRGVFMLSAVEYYMDDCYMMLDSLLEKLNEVDGLAFFSLSFLPKNEARRRKLYETILENGKELHFALENVSVMKTEDVEFLEDILAVRRLAIKSSQQLDCVMA